MFATSQHENRPRRRLPEERPAQILEAALAEFGERGLAGARLDDIARRAGVAKGTIYLYFPNKEELFREMVRTTMVARLAEAERLAETDEAPPTEQLVTFMRRRWQYLRTPAYSTIHRLVIAELRSFPDLAEFYSREVIQRSRRLVSGIIRRGVDAGEFRPVDPTVVSRIMAALFTSHALWCGNRDVFNSAEFPADDDVVLEQLIDFVLHALRAPAVPAPDASTTARQ